MIRKLLCWMGFHKWPVRWKMAHGPYGDITGVWYHECTEVGCFGIRARFNFDKEPK